MKNEILEVKKQWDCESLSKPFKKDINPYKNNWTIENSIEFKDENCDIINGYCLTLYKNDEYFTSLFDQKQYPSDSLFRKIIELDRK